MKKHSKREGGRDLYSWAVFFFFFLGCVWCKLHARVLMCNATHGWHGMAWYGMDRRRQSDPVYGNYLKMNCSECGECDDGVKIKCFPPCAPLH